MSEKSKEDKLEKIFQEELEYWDKQDERACEVYKEQKYEEARQKGDLKTAFNIKKGN